MFESCVFSYRPSIDNFKVGEKRGDLASENCRDGSSSGQL